MLSLRCLKPQVETARKQLNIRLQRSGERYRLGTIQQPWVQTRHLKPQSKESKCQELIRDSSIRRRTLQGLSMRTRETGGKEQSVVPWKEHQAGNSPLCQTKEETAVTSHWIKTYKGHYDSDRSSFKRMVEGRQEGLKIARTDCSLKEVCCKEEMGLCKQGSAVEAFKGCFRACFYVPKAAVQ